MTPQNFAPGEGATTGRPAVSVLMPVYNAERYLAEAVGSILAQTFADFEFLIVDDGSTDGSLAILRRFEASDPRVRLVSRPNTGYVTALNEMLGMARGELLARMDADDVALPHRFARQVEFLRDHPEVDALGGAQEQIDARGRFLYIHRDPVGHEEIQEQALIGRCPLNHPSVMMRRHAVLDLGGYRTEMMPSEDLDLWLRMGERGRLANLPEVVTRYRIHDGSISVSQQARQLDNMRRASEQACDRRGIPRRQVESAPWRPVDRESRHRAVTGYGWIGFGRGDRSMAREYALRSIALMPWRADGWRLLACTLLKNPPGPEPAEAGR